MKQRILVRDATILILQAARSLHVGYDSCGYGGSLC